MIKILSYAVIAPLILPRLCKDMGFNKKEVSEYSVFYNFASGNIKQEIIDTNGEKHAREGNQERDKKDNLMEHLFSKVPEGTAALLFQIIRDKKEIVISYFDNKMELIKINKY